MRKSSVLFVAFFLLVSCFDKKEQIDGGNSERSNLQVIRSQDRDGVADRDRQKSDEDGFTSIETVIADVKKPVIYQLVVRYFGNTNETNSRDGDISTNGVGKFSDINDKSLDELKKMGITHVYLTGVLQQSTATDYSDIGQPSDDPDILKGIAGSFFAVKDYYDVCPDYADVPSKRLDEFKALVDRIHSKGMKVMMDFVPNHVARSYASDIKPNEDFGKEDDQSSFFAWNNNFYYIQEDGPLLLPTLDSSTCNALGVGACDQKFEKENGESGNRPKVTGSAFGKGDITRAPKAYSWYETIRLNYGLDFTNGSFQFGPVPDTWEKMDRIIEYWQDMGINGFRVDWAHAIPNEFWKYLIDRAREREEKVLFIAEAHAGKDHLEKMITKGGFDAVYDYGTYDMLKKVFCYGENANNLDYFMTVKSHHAYIPEGLRGKLMRFAENHDELRIPHKKESPSNERQTGFGDVDAGKPVTAVLYTLGTGPVLMLNGQEVGEPAKGAEGFDGREGHTTIFDYWSMPEFRKWVNDHKYDGGGLNLEQKNLRKFYSNLMGILQTPAISEGRFYGLNWRNNERSEYGKKNLYSYFRYSANETLLIIANFSKDKNFDIDIVMPPDNGLALLGFSGGDYTFREILSNLGDKKISHDDLKTRGFPVNLDPYDVRIYRIVK